MKRYIKSAVSPLSNEDPGARQEVAKASDRSLDEQMILVKDSNQPVIDYGVVVNVARNPNTPIYVLEKLIDHDNTLVRKSIACRKDIPIDMLIKLSDDDNNTVRWVVASNPNTPVNLIVEFSNSREQGARRSVARNPSTPTYVLERLAQDSDWDVCQNAQYYLSRRTK